MTDLARFPVRKGTLPKLLLEVGRAERCVSYILGCLDFLFQPYGSKDQVRRAPVRECALQDHGAHEGDQDKPNSMTAPIRDGSEYQDQNPAYDVSTVFEVHDDLLLKHPQRFVGYEER